MINALVVTDGSGSGTVVASLVNTDAEDDALAEVVATATSGAPLEASALGAGIDIPAGEAVQLADEGVTVTDSAAHALARQAEGSSRDALSMLDQASVLGGGTVDDDVVRALLGAPRGEVQFELADAIAVGDARAMFEIVNRLVQDGQDLRNVTAQTLEHVRNLMLVKTAPGQEDLVDISADGYESLRIQAEKFTPSELARVIDLLLAAQNDMRWTTSPRLSLELALVRATMPETDPSSAGTLSRLERLERLANLEPGSVVPSAEVAGAVAAGDAARSSGSR